MKAIIDSHIHLDQYSYEDIKSIEKDSSLAYAIAVSMNLTSCKKIDELSKEFSFIKPAYGYHPEQVIPTEEEESMLLKWIGEKANNMIAIGEVGLPHYCRLENPTLFPLEPYIELLEQFILLAKKWDKPIILHSIYEEAPIAIKLLEKHSYNKAHFHWFKGDSKTVEHIKQNGYFLSITPDLLYEGEIQLLAERFPIEQIMVETDGPWPFEGPFIQQKTTPSMIHQTIKKLAQIKKENAKTLYTQLFNNTRDFYRL